MNDSNRSEKNRRSQGKKGYYIALALCLAAVGISGYVLISTTGNSAGDAGSPSLSVPLQPEKTPSGKTAAVSVTVAEPPDDPEKAIRDAADQVTVAPVKGEIIQPYSTEALSYNATSKDWRLHPAVDIAAEGQTVMACMTGTVTKVYDDDYLGTTVVLKHDGGYESRYSNLTAMPTVKEGDTVKAGDVIGAVGDTAILESADVPHLHFQVLQNGEPVDPTAFLQ